MFNQIIFFVIAHFNEKLKIIWLLLNTFQNISVFINVVIR